MVAPHVPGGVSDGRWHSVQVQYYNKVGPAPPHPTPSPGGRCGGGPGNFLVFRHLYSEIAINMLVEKVI